ncbi:hypothetical protein Micbo1qcDRAFT_156152 [Microdochium bolleyi]|uniref:GEgh 16 protein n=1 Tax=Microdochium bolleyi TaxID=196109 RepID=A0A136JJJ9_9PEZI|nr:hypothetical protein Micbo1qcDRAFT_156152 [Microdochium bolleyi]
MPSFASLLSTAALVALAQGHAVFLNAQGETGSPASRGFQVSLDIARNCTSINPCQQDTTIIRDNEIKNNVVNECGRTELTGNIDIGENTENALAAKQVTQVKAGSKVSVTVHQVNADGAGPYTCDLIEAGNNGVISQNLTVLDNIPGVNGFSQARTQQFNITVVMPQNFSCSGSSAGNVCTVRCRNNALAGPFGGCFPVQQTDTAAKVNTAAGVDTNISTEAVLKQVKDDQADFPAAVAANQQAGSREGLAAAKKVDDILNANGATLVSLAAPTQTVSVLLGGNPAAVPTATATPAVGGGAGAGRGGNNNNNGGQGRGQQGGNNGQGRGQQGGNNGQGRGQQAGNAGARNAGPSRRRHLSQAEMRGAY